jgi:hypothetical protein
MHGATSFSNMMPADFYACQIPDPTKVEEWIANIESLDVRAPERHWCAMCCVRGLLLAERLPSPSVEELFEMACAQGVYRPDQEIGWCGAYHKELAAFINTIRDAGQRKATADRSMRVLAKSRDDLWSMEKLVGWGCYILLSVHPDIRLRSSTPPVTKRGHFVLIFGSFRREGQRFFRINNPAGFQSQNSQIGMEVSAERLEQLTCGDGIVVKSEYSRLIGE